jgi:hypothetical protein
VPPSSDIKQRESFAYLLRKQKKEEYIKAKRSKAENISQPSASSISYLEKQSPAFADPNVHLVK